jgi:hypothetical protein
VLQDLGAHGDVHGARRGRRTRRPRARRGSRRAWPTETRARVPRPTLADARDRVSTRVDRPIE